MLECSGAALGGLGGPGAEPPSVLALCRALSSSLLCSTVRDKTLPWAASQGQVCKEWDGELSFPTSALPVAQPRAHPSPQGCRGACFCPVGRRGVPTDSNLAAFLVLVNK